MENAAYYGDIMEKNFDHCEEVYEGKEESIAKEERKIEGLEIIYLTCGQYAGV